MKHSLLTLALLGAVGTATTMPSKTTIIGLACLAGTGLVVSKNYQALRDRVVSTTKAANKKVERFIKKPANTIATLTGLSTIGAFMYKPKETAIILATGAGALAATWSLMALIVYTTGDLL